MSVLDSYLLRSLLRGALILGLVRICAGFGPYFFSEESVINVLVFFSWVLYMLFNYLKKNVKINKNKTLIPRGSFCNTIKLMKKKILKFLELDIYLTQIFTKNI